MPVLDIGAIPVRVGVAGYPEPFRARVGAVERRGLGRAGGLTTLGVNLTTLGPGQMTALRHWHEREDEFVFVVSGSPALIDGAGETALAPGDAAGFAAGVANAHHLANRGRAPAVLLEVGQRHAEERAHYPDDDLALVRRGGESAFSHRKEPVPEGRAPFAPPGRIDRARAPVVRGSDYPDPHRRGFESRVRLRLGDAAGLAQFGVNLTTLPPGGLSSLRHWHEVEDEMVFVLSGTLTLIDDDGEAEIPAGGAAAFPAGLANAHHFANRGAAPATYLEIGTRPAEDRCHYADVDLLCHDAGGRTWFTRADGSPLDQTGTAR